MRIAFSDMSKAGISCSLFSKAKLIREVKQEIFPIDSLSIEQQQYFMLKNSMYIIPRLHEISIFI